MALIFCFFVLPAFADVSKVQIGPGIADLESGIICPPPSVGISDAPDTVAGSTNLIEDEPPFISDGHRVPAVMGIGFGVKAMSTAAAGIGSVQMRVSHPPMGPEGVTQQSFLTSISGVDQSLTFYQFDHSYEVLVGTWTMEASKNGELLYRTSFEVVPASLLPDLATACGFEDLLS